MSALLAPDIMPQSDLTLLERERYRCQMGMEGFGEEAQLKLRGSTVGVVGLGGLGSVACQYLAAAGVGRLIIADPRTLEASDLGRQIMHWELDVRGVRTKAESLSWKLKRLNSRVKVEKVEEAVRGDNAGALLREADALLDCTNDKEGHRALNGFAVAQGVPLVVGAVHGSLGRLMVVVPGRTACLLCATPGLGPGPGGEEVMATAAGAIGALQANEAIKLLAGYGAPLAGRLLTMDLACNRYQLSEVSRGEGCELCGGPPKSEHGPAKP